jgi:hypothetical protein
MPSDTEDEITEQYDTINEFTVTGRFGFQRVTGPFEVEKRGTVWGIVVPTDAHPTVSTLSEHDGVAAVLLADGKSIGGGIVPDVVAVEDQDELHVLVDQYGIGGEEEHRGDEGPFPPEGFPPCPGCDEPGHSVQEWVGEEQVQLWQCPDSDCRVENYRPREIDPYESPRGTL